MGFSLKSEIPLSLFLSECLDHVAQRLVTAAKENGSTDNITIVVVFLRPVAEIKEIAEKRNSEEEVR